MYTAKGASSKVRVILYMKVQTKLRLTIILSLNIFVSCMYLPSDKESTLKGSEVLDRLQNEATTINNTYFNTNFKNSLPFKSGHSLGILVFMLPSVISINPRLNYEKEGVNDCVNKIRTIGLPLGGVPTLLTCDIREAGLIQIGSTGTGGKSAKKNKLLLNILALP